MGTTASLGAWGSGMDKRVGDEAPFVAVPSREQRSSDLARQILPSAGTMIAMCSTMVGLVKIAEGRIGTTRMDVYVALLGAAFLVSAVVAYVAIRTPRTSVWSIRCERAADAIFLAGLAAAVFVVGLFAFKMV